MDYYAYGEYYDTDYLDDHDEQEERLKIEKKEFEKLQERIHVRTEQEKLEYEAMLLGGTYALGKYLESTVTDYDLMLLNKGGRNPPNKQGNMGSF